MILPYREGTRVKVASPYGWRADPFTGEDAWHAGIDLVSFGSKEIVSVSDGIVGASMIITDPGNSTSEWGNYIRIDGYDGRKYYYCHLSARKASAGQEVRAGDVIGVEGSTGRSTGSHLHFEVRYPFNATMNPADILGVPNVAESIVIVEEKEDETVDEEKKQAQNDSEPSEWAKDAVEWAVENELLFGNGDGDLALRQPCTREQMLVFLYRFAEYLGKV